MTSFVVSWGVDFQLAKRDKVLSFLSPEFHTKWFTDIMTTLQRKVIYFKPYLEDSPPCGAATVNNR